MRRFNKKGQGMLEYVILLSAIIAAVLVAAGTVKTKMGTGFTNAATQMETDLATAFPAK